MTYTEAEALVASMTDDEVVDLFVRLNAVETKLHDIDLELEDAAVRCYYELEAAAYAAFDALGETSAVN